MIQSWSVPWLSSFDVRVKQYPVWTIEVPSSMREFRGSNYTEEFCRQALVFAPQKYLWLFCICKFKTKEHGFICVKLYMSMLSHPRQIQRTLLIPYCIKSSFTWEFQLAEQKKISSCTKSHVYVRIVIVKRRTSFSISKTAAASDCHDFIDFGRFLSVNFWGLSDLSMIVYGRLPLKWGLSSFLCLRFQFSQWDFSR